MGLFDDFKSLIEEVAAPVNEVRETLTGAKDEIAETVQQLGTDSQAVQDDLKSAVDEQVADVKSRFTGESKE